MVKIIIDSINEKELNKLIATSDGKSITKLEQFLKVNNKVNYEDYIAFLKDLQNLRSSTVAHRKGGNYEKVAKSFEIGNKLYSDIFENILNSLIEILEYLEANFLS